MQPLAQSILLESFPPVEHGKAMAVYGTGIVVAPVIGPTLGGWITDSYSWRWIFYINLPVGILAFFLAGIFIEDPPYLRTRFTAKIDALGFGMMALWLGTLQLVLDKGQEADWFEADWIRWTAGISCVAIIAFVARELTHREPIVHLKVFVNRDFAVGTLITGLYGVVLYSTTALLPLFLQTLLGYSALDSGLAVSPRGLGSMASMLIAGLIANRVDSRLLLAFGFFVLGASTLMLSDVNLGIAMNSVVIPNVLNGFAGGFIFVPLTTLAMSRLRKQEVGNAAGIYNLVRNIGGSIGIASATAFLVRMGQVHQNYLGANLSSSDSSLANAARGLAGRLALGGSDPVTAQHKALGAVYQMMQRQASLMSYVDSFRLLGYLSLACIPVVMLFRRPQRGGHSEPAVHSE
jgi:DHA2 family multidrug resistance protein